MIQVLGVDPGRVERVAGAEVEAPDAARVQQDREEHDAVLPRARAVQRPEHLRGAEKRA